MSIRWKVIPCHARLNCAVCIIGKNSAPSCHLIHFQWDSTYKFESKRNNNSMDRERNKPIEVVKGQEYLKKNSKNAILLLVVATTTINWSNQNLLPVYDHFSQYHSSSSMSYQCALRLNVWRWKNYWSSYRVLWGSSCRQWKQTMVGYYHYY